MSAVLCPFPEAGPGSTREASPSVDQLKQQASGDLSMQMSMSMSDFHQYPQEFNIWTPSASFSETASMPLPVLEFNIWTPFMTPVDTPRMERRGCHEGAAGMAIRNALAKQRTPMGAIPNLPTSGDGKKPAPPASTISGFAGAAAAAAAAGSSVSFVEEHEAEVDHSHDQLDDGLTDDGVPKQLAEVIAQQDALIEGLLARCRGLEEKCANQSQKLSETEKAKHEAESLKLKLEAELCAIEASGDQGAQLKAELSELHKKLKAELESVSAVASGAKRQSTSAESPGRAAGSASGLTVLRAKPKARRHSASLSTTGEAPSPTSSAAAALARSRQPPRSNPSAPPPPSASAAALHQGAQASHTAHGVSASHVAPVPSSARRSTSVEAPLSARRISNQGSGLTGTRPKYQGAPPPSGTSSKYAGRPQAARTTYFDQVRMQAGKASSPSRSTTGVSARKSRSSSPPRRGTVASGSASNLSANGLSDAARSHVGTGASAQGLRGTPQDLRPQSPRGLRTALSSASPPEQQDRHAPGQPNKGAAALSPRSRATMPALGSKGKALSASVSCDGFAPTAAAASSPRLQQRSPQQQQRRGDPGLASAVGAAAGARSSGAHRVKTFKPSLLGVNEAGDAGMQHVQAAQPPTPRTPLYVPMSPRSPEGLRLVDSSTATVLLNACPTMVQRSVVSLPLSSAMHAPPPSQTASACIPMGGSLVVARGPAMGASPQVSSRGLRGGVGTISMSRLPAGIQTG